MSLDHQPTRPVWLDDEFLKICVKNDVQATTVKDITVKDVIVDYAIPKGENYSSTILRVTLKANFQYLNTRRNSKNAYENARKSEVKGNLGEKLSGDTLESVTKVKRYIIKVLHNTKEVKTFVDEFGVFKKEVEMFQNIFPIFQNMLSNVGIDTTFSCRALHALPEENVLVMEDLCDQGYLLASRVEGANLDECKIFFRKLARLHASSMKYYEINKLKNLAPHYFKGIICNVENEQVQEMIDNMFGRTPINKKVAELGEVIKQSPGYEREYILIEKLKDISYDLIFNVFAYKPENVLFNALLHGDCWINNMLFRYDKQQRPEDVMLLDMQGVYYNSVANDFHYFFLSSASDDVRKYHYKCVVKIYYDALIDTLEKVDYKGVKPTLKQFYKELVDTSSFFLYVVSFMLPIIKADLSAEAKDRSKSESFSMDEMREISKDNFKNPRFVKTLLVTLDLMREEGFIDHHYEILNSGKL